MYLYGASGHCKVVIEAIKSSKKIKIDAVFDDNPKIDFILSVPVVNSDEAGFSDLNNFIITIGNNRIRKKIVQNLEVSYMKAIDSSAIISESAQIDFGTVILAGAIINAEAKIGKHCIINSGSVTEHDCIIEDFAHISSLDSDSHETNKKAISDSIVSNEAEYLTTNSPVISTLVNGSSITTNLEYDDE
jgi:acetyltransferase EpsM